MGKIPLAPNSNKNRLRINSCSAAFTFNVFQVHCMIPERVASNSNYSNCTPYLATSGRLIMIDADNPRPLVMTGPRHSMALQYIMAIISSVRSVRWCAVVPSSAFVYPGSLLSLAPIFLQEPSSKLPFLFILWIHRNWLDRNCLLHVHTETESGFRFETETGFDKWITPSV